ncbi:5-hydroxytryptamine receptor 1D-like [Lytechinus variegatus]|uniref:5-hydroxytryptamine receptor 1D-like n=1 Tax=Lytechinus variegatus TaxID=7654 RepID=UPI001BB2440F|nr:5-hydroxytryptamine receptor 1D-like [Lytechinus variegatus]
MMEGHNIVLAVVFSILAALGISGNTFLITAVFLSMKLRNVTNAFVVILGVSDIINSSTLIVQVIALAGLRSDAFMITCIVVGPIAITVLGASSIIMTLIAFCRFVLITKQPHTFRRIFSKRNVILMVSVSFILPLVLTLLFLFFDLATAGLNEDTICTFYNSPVFNTACGCVILVLLLIVCVLYGKIFLFLRRHFRQLRSLSVRSHSTVQLRETTVRVKSETGDLPRVAATPAQGRNLELESKITKNMVLVLVAFAVCFVPMSVTLLFSDSALLGAYCFAIFNLSSCLNPLLFGWKHPVFRQVFRCMFRRKLEDIEEPATWLRKIQQRS